MLGSIYTLRRHLPYAGINLSPKQPPAVVLSMDDAYFVGLGSEGKTWSAKAKKVEIGQNRSLTRLTGIHDGKILQSGKPVFAVKAGAAIYDTYTKDLQLAGGVLINGLDGQTISAQGAIWNSATQSLRSTGEVEFRQRSNKIRTDQMRVNLRNREMEMWNVTMSFNLEDVTGVLREADQD